MSCEVEKAVVTGSCRAAESSTPPGLNIYIEDMSCEVEKAAVVSGS